MATEPTIPHSRLSRRAPLISVVMPVYNAGDYLVDALASIVEQSHRDWEMICVDDGSSDRSGAILDWFAQQDERIQVVHQANAGIVAALSLGCGLAKAPLICRMDSDDIALPERLNLQAEYLRLHPTCAVVGGAILEMDQEGDPLVTSRLPGRHEEIVDGLLQRRTGHFHPTTMFRAEAFEAVGGYRKQYEWVEDHDLWLRMAHRGRLANLRDIVLCYRQHASSICWRHCSKQRELMNELLREAYRVRGRDVPEQVLAGPSPPRSSAGPGKWARAAAKGGYPITAIKHLRRLLHTQAPTSYKARMIVEASLRLIGGTARRVSSSKSARVPQFAAWQARVDQALDSAASHRRAA